MSIPTSGPGTGIYLERTVYKMIATTAVVAGDVMVSDGTVDATTQVLDTMVQVSAAAELESGLLGVAMDTIAAGATGPFLFRGFIDAQTAGTPAVGAKLSGNSGALTLGAAGATEKVIGIALETGTTTPTKVAFNGIEGFGNDNA